MNIDLEIGRSLNETSRRARVQAVLVMQGQNNFLTGFFNWRRFFGSRPWGFADLFLFGEQGLLSLAANGVEIAAQANLHTCGNAALHKRCRAEPDFFGNFGRQQFHCRLCAQDGAAQIHHDQHAIRRSNALDGFTDLDRVGADLLAIFPHAGGYGDVHIWRSHLPDQVYQRIGQFAAMRDNDQTDHTAILFGIQILDQFGEQFGQSTTS